MKSWPLLLLNCIFMAVGSVGGPLLIRLYFLHGGKRSWLITTLQTAAFPITFLPLTFLFRRSRSQGIMLSLFLMEPKLFMYSCAIGVFYGLSNYLNSIGLTYLPVSTTILLQATQLVFIAVFAWFFVGQRFTSFSINAVVLMVVGCVVLGVRANGDRPRGVSHGEYLLGFLLTLGNAALIGGIGPCIELCYSKARRAVDFSVLLQFNLSVSVSATVFSVIGMIANTDFQFIHREAKEYELGSVTYWMAIIGAAIFCQLDLLGSIGVVFTSNSVFFGIFNSILVPITDIAALIAFHEPFTAEKGVALALCLWGFVSYFYGDYKMMMMSKMEEVDDDTASTEAADLDEQCNV